MVYLSNPLLLGTGVFSSFASDPGRGGSACIVGVGREVHSGIHSHSVGWAYRALHFEGHRPMAFQLGPSRIGPFLHKVGSFLLTGQVELVSPAFTPLEFGAASGLFFLCDFEGTTVSRPPWGS